jgi:signal-transduction protein with cAMP-binding, CBS, and nucleotidyltransferase domain
MDVGEICTRTVIVATRELVLSEAARLMRQHHVGTIVVIEEIDEGRVPVGMLTDRDIVVGVVAKDVDARTLSVGEVMSGDLVSVREQDSVFDALRLMRSRGVRRVPVTSGAAGLLIGILAVDDVLEIVAEQLREIVRAIGSERTHEQRARG